MDKADIKNQKDQTDQADQKKEDVEVRALTFCVVVADSDFAMIKDLIHRYAHFQNVYIMLRDAAFRGAFPEKEIERFRKNEAFRRGKCLEEGKTFEPKAEPTLDFSEESKTRHAGLLRSVSRPGVVRSLFQKRSPGAALKREETRLRNILAKDPKKHGKELEKKEKKATNGKANDSALADQVMADFPDFRPLKNVLDAGTGLKSHVIFNLVKRVDSAYSNAFAKFEKTGRFCPPRTKRLEEIESFFVPLCTVSISKVGGGGLSINLSDRSVPVSLPLAATAQLQNKEPTSLSVGISHGKLCITVPYDKPKSDPATGFVKQKYAGLDLGIRYLATIFVDDDKTPSVCIPGGDAAKFNDRFNQKTEKLHGRYSLRCKKLKKMRTDEAKKRGVEYVKDVDMILSDAAYAAEAELRGAEKAELNRLLFKRHEYFQNLMHKTARRILEHLKEAGVTKLFCSRNLGDLKRVGSKMAKENRKRFHQIPILKLLDYLKLNGAEYGIEVDQGVNEAYSSKISALKGAEVLAANKRKKEELADQATEKLVKKESLEGTNGVGVETKPQSGTIPRGGSRNGRRFIEKATKSQKSRRSWHADVNGAANHITIGLDAPIKWNKRKIAKLCSPVVINTSRLTWLSFGLIPGGLRPQARGLRHGARDPHLPNAEAV
jgi:IS605 OrfB family transposase